MADLAAKARAGQRRERARRDGSRARTPQSLREAADPLQGRLGEAVIVLGTVADDKVSLVASVSPATSKKMSAGDLVGEIAKIVGGRGGGRPDFAQAGGTDPSKLEAPCRRSELVAGKLGGT